MSREWHASKQSHKKNSPIFFKKCNILHLWKHFLEEKWKKKLNTIYILTQALPEVLREEIQDRYDFQQSIVA